jgi:type II secretory pathway pseudopilin PulG
MKVHFHKHRGREHGYILLVLMLALALLSMALLAGMQNIAFEIKRDREEEMIHRGTQYARAARLFVQKFHRYPGSIEELENTNNIRFLRKRYKDPITGKDFQPLYMDKVAAFYRPPVPQPLPEPQGTKLDPSSPEYAQYAAEEAEAEAEAYGHPLPQGSNDTSVSVANPAALPPDGASTAAGAPIERTDEEDEAPPLKGVPIVGVASLSKKETIRQFDRKDHYNQWLFIFNPNSPSSATGLIKTPDQPSRMSTAQAQNLQNPDQPSGVSTAQAQNLQNEHSDQSAGNQGPLNARPSPRGLQRRAK